MRQASSKLALAIAAFALTGCSHFFIQKDGYGAVKKAALVQFALNPHLLLGTPTSDDVRAAAADHDANAFVAAMSGKPYQLVPLAELTAQPAYAAEGRDKWDGYYTGKGMRFSSTDEDALQHATLAPDQAQRLCNEVGVDAVVVVYESWGERSAAMGFQMVAANAYWVNMYDKNGVRVWGDVVRGGSDDGVPSPGGIISIDQANFITTWGQALTAAMNDLAAHLGR
jgi:hypothetical protein